MQSVCAVSMITGRIGTVVTCRNTVRAAYPIMMMFLVPGGRQCYLFLPATCYADKSRGGARHLQEFHG